MKKNNLIKIFFILSFTISSLFALKQDEIKSKMTEKIDNVLLVLEKKELTTEQKGDEIIKIIDDVFDYELMAKIALGKDTWTSISKEKQDEFIKIFEAKLKKSYIEKLELYTDQKVKIVDLIPYKNSRLQLQSQLVGKNETYEINYNFYNKDKENDTWLIYDVDLVGVSIIQTYRQQFSGLLKEKTFDEMLTMLKDSLNDTPNK